VEEVSPPHGEEFEEHEEEDEERQQAPHVPFTQSPKQNVFFSTTTSFTA